MQVVGLGGKERLERLLVAGELEVDVFASGKLALKTRRAATSTSTPRATSNPALTAPRLAPPPQQHVDELHGDRRASLLCETMKIFIR